MLLGALATPTHGTFTFFSCAAPLARPAVLAPGARRRSSSPRRRSVTKVGTTTTTTTLYESNGAALQTTVRPSFHDLDQKTVEMEATVTVHMKSFFSDMLDRSLDEFFDIFGKSWLHLELISSELDQDGREHKPIPVGFKNPKKHDAEFGIYQATFDVPASFGPIGAVHVTNSHHSEMLLGDIKVFPAGQESSAVTFHCSSWIHPSDSSTDKRIFFPLKYSCLPSQTPKGVEKLRKSELEAIRGSGHGERTAHERIYDYDVYNDLGDPDHDIDTKRPVLGGKDHPYPRRGRTGRPRSKADPLSETRTDEDHIYVPRDEAFSERKQAAFNTKLNFSKLHAVSTYMKTSKHKGQSFPSLAAIDAMYEDRSKNQPQQKLDGWCATLDLLEKELSHLVHLEGAMFLEEIRKVIKFETPEIHDRDKFAWFRDEEFARETLAGINPLSIQLVTELPIVSKLDEVIYGPADSLITKELIDEQIDRGMTADEAVKKKKLFMLDYHDMFLPYVHKVREIDDTTLYGSRTLFFLTEDGMLRPIAIELTRPMSPSKPQWREVYTPGCDGSVTGSWLWQLAKTHVLAHDSGYHQLVSHWLRTHCCVEPYIIAANRQLSQMHPIYRLLHPHFRYTMELNAIGRVMLISGDGAIESVFSPRKYCMELSSLVYDKFWRFDMEGLPEDLIRRGMAVKGGDGKLELVIEDYPYANDGLLIWDAIKEWASEYVEHYYPCTADIIGDEELQGWWTEVRTKGHEDKKDEPWWPKIDNHESLVQVLATIMWVTSAHHAAVNFGQYPYAGYFPNRPTVARRNMPSEMGVEGMNTFEEAPEKVLLDTFPSIYQSYSALAIMDLLSSHSPDEEYMGTYQDPAWKDNVKISKAFAKFKGRLIEIVAQINEWNTDRKRKNRHGAGVVPYVLLKPSDGNPMDEKMVMEMGIPNSISI
uniref:Lipoxygenase n=1 Tax=Hordeum vulgare subsp. vulgare TaxID=112509 RepID=F2DM79_HORVV|nr:predicted protein [Hordeum vulgare subsp. vulgare]